jgi:hypothetical protein
MNSLKDLTFEEQKFIQGGAPDKGTSFLYDVTYYLSYGLRKFFTPPKNPDPIWRLKVGGL